MGFLGIQGLPGIWSTFGSGQIKKLAPLVLLVVVAGWWVSGAISDEDEVV